MINDDDDFGFSLEHYQDDLNSAMRKPEEKIEEILDLIYPFLQKLCENPDKEFLKWPNRAEKCEELMKRLEEIKNR